MNTQILYGVWRDKPARFENGHVQWWQRGQWIRLAMGYDTEFRVFPECAQGNEDLLRNHELKTTAQ